MGRVVGEKPDDPTKVKLLLSVNELQTLTNLLSELPYNKSYKMIHKIMEMGASQAERIMGVENE